MKKNSITLNVLADISRQIGSGSARVDGQEKVLVVLAGSNINMDRRLEELREMQEEGLGIDLAFSFMSENIMERDRIISSLKPDRVFTEKDVFELKKIRGDYGFLIGPNITINTLSKVANGMIDSFLPTIIWAFLYEGKKVYLDYESTRKFMGEECKNDRILDLVESKIGILSEMGAVEIEEGSYVEQVLDIGSEVEETTVLSPKKGRRVITAGDLDKIKGKTLVLDRGDIVTPLARDKARKLDIDISSK